MTTDFATFNQMVNNFPDIRVRMLSGVARRGRDVLRNDFLSGQALNLKKDLTDKIGRYLVNGRVGRRSTVGWSSYPANLFERGRTLRDGRREPGRHIIMKQFKGKMEGRIQGFADAEAQKTLEKAAEAV